MTPEQNATDSTVDQRVKDFERVIIGIDPGTNVMGYGILGINGKKTATGGYGRD